MTPDSREWLVTNGLGGYASGTVEGPLRRRYHGLLIAALPAPLGRTVLLTELRETIETASGDVPLIDHLEHFGLDEGLPVWRYRIADAVVEKRVLMPYQQNTVHVGYSCGSDAPLTLRLRPIVGFRPHETAVNETVASGYSLTIQDHRLEIGGEGMHAELRLLLHGRRGDFIVDHLAIDQVRYLTEEHRGYEATGALWSPGTFRVRLGDGEPITLIASNEPWHAVAAVDPHEARRAEYARRRQLVSLARTRGEVEHQQLVLAADQFVVIPPAGPAARHDGARARTVIAGYHWFTDWGRDTMISLEGLTLVTGRHREAADILRRFAGAERDGLIPNFFPEGDAEGVYHTADATLWFFHAISRYVAHTDDRSIVRELLPVLRRIIDAHVKGTRFGIGIDPADGLLTQGQEGYQLTWMDAKVDGWVVTPRRGKAVEINALWFNALRLMEGWLSDEEHGVEAGRIRDLAERARASFNARFWSDDLGHLFDVVDMRDAPGGDDPACRPNQIFAIALEHPVLDRSRWQAVVRTVEERLLTPVGLRSLAPGHPDYKARYFGDLRTRDAAYHQGTVWGWLIGPAVDAWLKTHPGDSARARRLLDGLITHLDDAGAGSISEIFDAEPPYTPRGCIAQAWSVAEVQRCLWKINAARQTIPEGR